MSISDLQISKARPQGLWQLLQTNSAISCCILPEPRPLLNIRPVFQANDNRTKQKSKNDGQGGPFNGGAARSGGAFQQAFPRQRSNETHGPLEIPKNPQTDSADQQYSTAFDIHQFTMQGGAGTLQDLLIEEPREQIVDIAVLAAQSKNFGSQQHARVRDSQRMPQSASQADVPDVASLLGFQTSATAVSQLPSSSQPINPQQQPAAAIPPFQPSFETNSDVFSKPSSYSYSQPPVQQFVQPTAAKAPLQQRVTQQEPAPPGGAFVQELQWQYVDLSNVIQGPFLQSKMRRWYLTNHLSDQLKIKAVGRDQRFTPLAERWRVVGAEPFSCDPGFI